MRIGFGGEVRGLALAAWHADPPLTQGADRRAGDDAECSRSAISISDMLTVQLTPKWWAILTTSCSSMFCVSTRFLPSMRLVLDSKDPHINGERIAKEFRDLWKKSLRHMVAEL